MVNKNSFCIAEYREARIAREMAEILKNFLEEKRSSPNNPCTSTAINAAKGVYGLATALITITIIVALTIFPFLSERKASSEINIEATPPTIIPVKGTLKACSNPPSAASFRAHNAVILGNDFPDAVNLYCGSANNCFQILRIGL